MNVVKITANSSSKSIKAQLNAITALVVACCVLIAILILMSCITGRFPQSLWRWLRRGSAADAVQLEEGDSSSKISKEERKRSLTDDAGKKGFRMLRNLGITAVYMLIGPFSR